MYVQKNIYNSLSIYFEHAQKLYTSRARKSRKREHALVVNARAVEEEFCLEEREREREAKHSKRISQGLSPSPKHREVASIEEEEEEEEEDEEEGQK